MTDSELKSDALFVPFGRALQPWVARLTPLLAKGQYVKQFQAVGLQVLSRLVATAGCAVVELAGDLDPHVVVDMLATCRHWHDNVSATVDELGGHQLKITPSTKGLAQLLVVLFDDPRCRHGGGAAYGHCTVGDAQTVQHNFLAYLAWTRNGHHSSDDNDDKREVDEAVQRACAALEKFIEHVSPSPQLITQNV
jgi:hypothetical protein